MIVTAKIEKLENGKLVLKPDVDISRFLALRRPAPQDFRYYPRYFFVVRAGAGRTSALSGMGFLFPLSAGVVLPFELRYDHGPRVYYIPDSVLLPLGSAHKGQPAHPDG